MLIGRSVFPSPCGRSPRADEVMAFGRRTVTMSFSGLRLIFTIGGSAGAVCGSYEPRGPQPPHAEARHCAVAPFACTPQAATHRRKPPGPQAMTRFLPKKDLTPSFCK